VFLDRELKNIQKAKDTLAKRMDLRRMTIMLDILSMRAKARAAVSGLRAGLAAAELVRDLLSGRKNRGC
jgi:hypothetical protein